MMNPSDYKEYLSQYTDPDVLLDTLANLQKTFRINTLKCSERFFESFTNLERRKEILPRTFSCDKDFPIGKTIEFFTGMIHTQTMSSMIPPFVMKPEPNDIILDLAAAPGGKTTQISEMMKNNGVVVANDVKFDRLSVLVGNARRLGALNIMVTRQD
ncbi:MAG: RsmB/NOP family class I SAM-dependent RNA methyltransferase, partial [Candidatus Micrarchaeota archaeon]|nr:RsmB/NOP family class I SAM-dependent RNA methyltransferase [Candidatus Micrarchaeota archaeon]